MHCCGRGLGALSCEAGKAVPTAGGNFEVLEFEPFNADESDLLDFKLCKTIKTFLGKHKPADVPAVPPLRMCGCAHNMLGQVAVSLSGGVDSMVVAKALQALAVEGKFKVSGTRIAAYHVSTLAAGDCNTYRLRKQR